MKNYDKALKCYEEERYKSALKYLKKAKRAYHDTKFYFYEGVIFLEKGQIKKAIKIFKKGLLIDSKKTYVYAGLGDAYIKLNEYDTGLSTKLWTVS